MGIFGRPGWRDDPAERQRIASMSYPVRCTHCNTIYDAGSVTVIQRYADCSVWISPCCKLQVDDRGSGPFGKSRPDIEEIRKADIR